MVSVILPTFNRAGLLARAIESVLAQTHSDWELIVVDDGSTDETASIVRGYRRKVGPRIRYFRQPRSGASVARNTGLDRARGRWLAFLDSDDAFTSAKLARQVGLFEDRPDLGLVFCDMSVAMVDGAWHESTFETFTPYVRAVPHERLDGDACVCGPSFFECMVRRYCIPTITAMVSRDVVEAGIRFPPGHAYSEEWLFFLEVASGYPCGFVDAPLCVQHCQASSVSHLSSVWNTSEQYRALRVVETHFCGADASARRSLHGQLAACCRQLGFDAFKRGRYADALTRFGEALRHRPSVRDALYLGQAWWRRATHAGTPVSGMNHA